MATIWNKKLNTSVPWLVAAVTGGALLLNVGRGPVVKNITSSHIPSATQEVQLGIPFVADVSATGSLTIKTTGMDGKAGTKYAAACIPNPLLNVGVGSGQTTVGRNSGSLLRLKWHNIYNPAAIGGDIGFVRDCTTDGTGATIIDNVCTATGCTSIYSTATADWSGVQYIKLGLRGNPTSGFRAVITGSVEDTIGE